MSWSEIVLMVIGLTLIAVSIIDQRSKHELKKAHKAEKLKLLEELDSQSNRLMKYSREINYLNAKIERMKKL